MPVVNGTTYHDETPLAVIDVLETARRTNARIRIHYGYTTTKDGQPTGRDWYEENDVTGTVGRSSGPQKVPIILANSRSTGGGSILDHCIVRIREPAWPATELYRHPKYSTGRVTLQVVRSKVPNGPLLTVAVLIDGENHAQFEKEKQARYWIAKMGLEAVQTTFQYIPKGKQFTLTGIPHIRLATETQTALMNACDLTTGRLVWIESGSEVIPVPGSEVIPAQ